MSSLTLRSYREADASSVNVLALAAFDQFRSHYSDWPAMASGIGRMSALADVGEIIVAEGDGSGAGRVGRFGALDQDRVSAAAAGTDRVAGGRGLGDAGDCADGRLHHWDGEQVAR
jgi:hypothetical protein